MRWTRRRVQTVTTWVVVVAWVVFYAVALANADPLPPPETAVVQLVVPPLLWVVAARLVLRHWWSGPGSRMSAMDLPGRLLAAAAAALTAALRRVEIGRACLMLFLVLLIFGVTVHAVSAVAPARHGRPDVLTYETAPLDAYLVGLVVSQTVLTVGTATGPTSQAGGPYEPITPYGSTS